MHDYSDYPASPRNGGDMTDKVEFLGISILSRRVSLVVSKSRVDSGRLSQTQADSDTCVTLWYGISCIIARSGKIEVGGGG